MAFTENQKIVAEYYIASLGRSPDVEGLNFWAGKLDSNEMTVNQVRDMFLDKSIPEVAARFPENQDSLTTVSNIYENVFGREGDVEGLNYWANRLDGSIDGFEPLGENELITIMINTAKDPQNYIDGAYLQNKLNNAENSYLEEQNIDYIVTNGTFTNASNTDVILQDFAFDISGTFSGYGETFSFDMEGSLENGFYIRGNGEEEFIAGYNFPDQIIYENESFYFNDFLPTSVYEDIPDVSGQMTMEVSLITNVGTFTDETIGYF
ncbi:hypothetical protein CP965_11025 [Halarcobacter mediterraneus]|uniref:DUF4214 domain-containing protein n=1 Tax=Halarcobacter mediterraneus TaxID=2023153 RepID=A0A4Q1AUR9_9BACT|nr:DUF4214 domain-containing protein [Halarcobacter mediterraneus]RXK12290.1 hypothetical protein CP965_11025 [Halarcobacter mediterraneus]